MEENRVKFDGSQLIILFSSSSAPPPFFSNWKLGEKNNLILNPEKLIDFIIVPKEIKEFLDFPKDSFKSNLQNNGEPKNEYIRERLRSVFIHELPKNDNYVTFYFTFSFEIFIFFFYKNKVLTLG